MKELIAHLKCYNYPSKLYDFTYNKELEFRDYRCLENHIREFLLSNDEQKVKNGLSNVLYWGHYRAGYRDFRVKRFRDNVTWSQIKSFQSISKEEYDCIKIKKIKMPEFSGLAFISKILMFLEPDKYVTLDKKIMKLKDITNSNNPLTKIKFGKKETSIRITIDSQKHYLEWCQLCMLIAKNKPNDNILAVDIERAFFQLVENGKEKIGQNIIRKFRN